MNTKHILRGAVLSFALVAAGLFASGADYRGLNFSHPLHVGQVGAECTDCHDGIMDTHTGDRIAMPDHAACGACHEVDDNEQCSMCHEGTPQPTPLRFSGDRYTNYAHGGHQGLECTGCHGPVADADPVFPGVASCRACHENLDVKPVTHRLETWSHDHGLDASMAEADCAVCHLQSSCDDCHQGSNVLANKPHPPQWRFTHGLETMYGEECLVCHETRADCIKCHRALVPTPHELGPQWANSEGGDHTEEAGSFMPACLACHDVENQDPVCARCHK